MRVLVSILALDRYVGTTEAVEAALRHIHDSYFVLTDNGSKDGTAAYFDQVKARFPDRVTVFHEEQNTGFKMPHDRAFRIANRMGIDFMFCLNDDAIVDGSTVESLLAPFPDNPLLAITGTSHTCCQLDHDFHGSAGQRVDYIEMSAAMIHVRRVASLGRPNLFAEELIGAYSEDADLSLFVRERGLEVATIPIKITHYRSSTSNSTPELRAQCKAWQEHNHAVNRKRWTYYLERKRMDFPVVLVRKEALGDVLLLTPVIRAIKESNPLVSIYVETAAWDIFARNPHVKLAGKSIQRMEGEMRIVLDMASENRPFTHLAEAYAEEVRKHLPGVGQIELRTEIFPSEDDIQSAAMPLRTRRLCIMHAGGCNWPGKRWAMERFESVATSLIRDGFAVASVGDVHIKGTSNWCESDRPTIHQLACILNFAQLFIGIDSFPMHVALSVGCPTVGLFGISAARYILTGQNRIGIQGTGPDSGKRQMVAGKTFVEGGEDCMNSITPEMVMQTVKKLGVL